MSHSSWIPAYIGVGSNLNDPKAQTARGVDALATLPQTRLIAVSRVFRSAPMGPQDQPQYANAVAGLLTQLDPSTLLENLKRLERDLGRTEPVVRWGARMIDFDLLVFGIARIQSAELTVPHPGIAERDFVLVPLQDVAPELEVPGVGRVNVLAARIGAQLQVW